MTTLQQSALDYYDEANKRAARDPELKAALDQVILTIRRWTSAGWEGSVTGAANAYARWLMSWDKGGRVGGLARFRNGLKLAMKAANHEVVPGTYRVVQSVADGLPSFDRSTGPFRCLLSVGSQLVKEWNSEEKEKGSAFRYRCTTKSALARQFPGLAMRLILRYEIKIRELKHVSLDEIKEEREDRSSVWEDTLDEDGRGW
jgi:hypothetical protein